MAGHSKWNNIKNRKSAVDAKKSKAFGNLSKLIRIAVKEGGSGDPQFNPGLRTLLEKAKEANMPKEKVQKAINNGLGKTSSGRTVVEALYEAFGASGEAYLIQLVTDNTQRTSAEIRAVLSRRGGSLAGPGSAQYLFQRTNNGSFEPIHPLSLSIGQLEKANELLESLRDHDDVEEVFSTFVQTAL